MEPVYLLTPGERRVGLGWLGAGVAGCGTRQILDFAPEPPEPILGCSRRRVRDIAARVGLGVGCAHSPNVRASSVLLDAKVDATRPGVWVRGRRVFAPRPAGCERVFAWARRGRSHRVRCARVRGGGCCPSCPQPRPRARTRLPSPGGRSRSLPR